MFSSEYFETFKNPFFEEHLANGCFLWFHQLIRWCYLLGPPQERWWSKVTLKQVFQRLIFAEWISQNNGQVSCNFLVCVLSWFLTRRIELIEACHDWKSGYWCMTMMTVYQHPIWSCQYKHKVLKFCSVDILLCHQRTELMLRTYGLQVQLHRS